MTEKLTDPLWVEHWKVDWLENLYRLDQISIYDIGLGMN